MHSEANRRNAEVPRKKFHDSNSMTRELMPDRLALHETKQHHGGH